MEGVAVHRLVLDTHLRLGVVQGFSRSENEGYPGPTAVVDVQHHQSECGRKGVLRDVGVLRVAALRGVSLPPVVAVLSQDDVAYVGS